MLPSPLTQRFLGATLALASTLALTAAPAAATPVRDASTEAGAPALNTTALAVRHQQLDIHQIFGLTTLGAMALTLALGKGVSDGWLSATLREPHMVAGGLTTGLYLATATLSLTAPPSPLGEHTGWDSVAIHRNLGWLHMAGMASTVGLGLANILGPGRGNLSEFHGLASYATLGLMATSAAVVAFGE